MDIHNIDDYLDLQDQTETNLLATEQIASQSTSHEHEEEWHAVSTPLNDMLTSNSYFNQTPNWDVLNNTNRAILTTTAENFVTPEALIKTPTPPPPPPPPPPEQPEAVNDNQQGTRVTRSSKNKTSPAVNKKKKAETRAKKLYCICQKPYKGELMVQCDKCSEW
jgi:type IV secretory pathway VirB10-like protein